MKGVDLMKISKLNLARIFLWVTLIVSFVLITQKYPLILLYDMPEPTYIDFIYSIIYFSSIIVLSLLSNFKKIKFITIQTIFAIVLISYLVLLSKDMFIPMLVYALFFVPFTSVFSWIDFNAIHPICFILCLDIVVSLCMMLGHLYRKKHNK